MPERANRPQAAHPNRRLAINIEDLESLDMSVQTLPIPEEDRKLLALYHKVSSIPSRTAVFIMIYVISR